MVTFRDKILHKCIAQEMLHSTGCSDSETFRQLVEMSGFPVKNVCVRMSVLEKARLEATVDMVDMTIQEFVTNAIEEAIGVACGVLETRGQMAAFNQVYESKLAAEKIRLVPDETDSNLFRFELIEREGE